MTAESGASPLLRATGWALLAMACFGPFMPFVWITPGVAQLGWLALLGVAGALNLADASFVAPFDVLKLPFGATLAFFLFGGVSYVWTWVGAGAIIAAGYLNARIGGGRMGSGGG